MVERLTGTCATDVEVQWHEGSRRNDHFQADIKTVQIAAYTQAAQPKQGKWANRCGRQSHVGGSRQQATASQHSIDCVQSCDGPDLRISWSFFPTANGAAKAGVASRAELLGRACLRTT